MRWTVEGADKETGQDRVITVEADTRDQAEKIATGKGLLVSDIHKPVSLTEAEKAAEQLDALDALAAEVPAPSGGRISPMPGYEDLQSGAKVLSFLGSLTTILGAISVAGGAVIMAIGIAGRMNIPANALPEPETAAQIAGGASAVISGIIGVCSGAIMSMWGSAAMALRDIARNSFR